MQRQPNFGLIVAAGRGTRFGGPKQFASLGGRPLVEWSLLEFEHCPRISGYVLVTRPGDVPRARRLAKRLRLCRLMAVVPGGKERADSVRLGLAALPPEGYVAVHDAARPFVTSEMLERGFRLCRLSGAATFASPVYDTLKKVRDGRIVSTIPRESVFAVQTPQFFSLATLRAAHARARGRKLTDDCAAVELSGVRPAVIFSQKPNPKVTTRADLAFIKALL